MGCGLEHPCQFDLTLLPALSGLRAPFGTLGSSHVLAGYGTAKLFLGSVVLDEAGGWPSWRAGIGDIETATLLAEVIMGRHMLVAPHYDRMSLWKCQARVPRRCAELHLGLRSRVLLSLAGIQFLRYGLGAVALAAPACFDRSLSLNGTARY